MNKFRFLLGLFIYKLTFIHKKRIVFTSFNGHYSDNPRAISEKMHMLYPALEIVWLLSKQYWNNAPDYVKKIPINSLKAFYYRGTAKAQVDNVYGFRMMFLLKNTFKKRMHFKIFSVLVRKKRQIIYTNFHGTALKKIGRDQNGNEVLDATCSDTYLLVGDELTADVLKRTAFDKIPVMITGTPRNDALFTNRFTKGNLGIPEEKKVILFAPTFRNDGKDVEGKNVYRSGINQLQEINFDLLFNTLHEKFGGDWVMILRFHYHVANMVDWDTLNAKYPGKFINGNLKDDMVEYLCATDILLTDSSSCMFDFALTKKPCFLFFPDYEIYKDHERGFYQDVKSLPFSLAQSFNVLIDNIKSFDSNNYADDVDRLMDRIGSANGPNSLDKVIEFIVKKSYKNKL